ncbi:MAG: hypothetical protein PHI12_12035 [Dehalococcoidales bacterium]|nr:hypothetical protein [Dehalococcoidales bacterium]
MWDIDSLVRSNNQASLDWMMRGRQSQIAVEPHPKAWPLSVLASRMLFGPVNLEALIALLTDATGNSKFFGLVRKFLPEYEKKIMRAAKTERVYEFCQHFSQKYYPVPGGYYTANIAGLLETLPVDLFGLSYTSYEDMSMRDGYLCLLSLLIYPFTGDDRLAQDDEVPFVIRGTAKDAENQKWKPTDYDIGWLRHLISIIADGGVWRAPTGFSITKIDDNHIKVEQAKNTAAVKEVLRRTLIIAQRLNIHVEFKAGRSAAEKKERGPRIVLLEKVSGLVGRAIVERIPEFGWTPEEIHKLVDGTKYADLAAFADWALGKTGCRVLDKNYEHCSYVEGESEPIFKWSQYNIESLAREWPRAKAILDHIDNITDWVEKNTVTNFGELVNFLSAHYTKPKSRKIPSNAYDPFEPLDLEMVIDSGFGETDEEAFEEEEIA